MDSTRNKIFLRALLIPRAVGKFDVKKNLNGEQLIFLPNTKYWKFWAEIMTPFLQQF